MKGQMEHRGRYLLVSILLGIVAVANSAVAQKNIPPGVTDTEIKIGQTMPYSGPASAWGTVGRAELAYFKMINDQGGINGRKIILISQEAKSWELRAATSLARLWNDQGKRDDPMKLAVL